ncbi:MAG: DUF308 domain-containing protein [Muribaculaceae bacterium]|nr:DUF308 domain-containing protein [Muribaculaceae bacterium]
MKSKNYVITYLSALVIGILLLIYHQDQAIYQTIVMVIGALIAVPSLVLLLTMLVRKRPAASSTAADAVAIASAVAAAAGLAFGIWMICTPEFFIKAIIYTLGAILILVGVAQMTYVYQAARPFRPAIGWFIVPFLTLLAGVVIILLGPDKVSSSAGLITGIVLVVYAANGFASAGREAKLQHDVEDMEKEKLREEAEDRRRDEKAGAMKELEAAGATKAGDAAAEESAATGGEEK